MVVEQWSWMPVSPVKVYNDAVCRTVVKPNHTLSLLSYSRSRNPHAPLWFHAYSTVGLAS